MSAAPTAYTGSLGREDGRDSDSWYTPASYLEAGRRTLRRFDLDPFSSATANAVVQAERFLTVEDDAFVTDWSGPAVWMNPPYSRGLCAQAADRFVQQYEAGAFKRGIVLTNNATDTFWFNTLLESASAVCFTDHRIAFVSPDGKAVSGNTRGQAFFLYESDGRAKTLERFRDNFAPFGAILEVSR